MVNRSEMTGKFDEFEGTVESVELEHGIEDRRQYHIIIKPTSMKVQGATGRIHEWVPLSPRATEESVPQGSVADRYLTQVEIVISEAKKAKTVGEALKLMIGKNFGYKKIKLGKDFDGKAAKEYIVPVKLVGK